LIKEHQKKINNYKKQEDSTIEMIAIKKEEDRFSMIPIYNLITFDNHQRDVSEEKARKEKNN
jgi:hypothetical protein